MTDPADMIIPLHREMRGENLTRHAQTRALAMVLEKRPAGAEESRRSFGQALTADTLLSKPVAGEFEERIEALENCVKELEGQK
ncbi:hypothetical protein [Bradyrhizobium sp.]|uniref:hypothetical protein n=1 Tax=Bradyrhizobium sp. TaxID=376 RepID=UPI003C43E162